MHPFKSKRGSILLVTMLFAGAIAIFLGSYLTISGTALQASNRSIYANAASNLVDTGLDEVMWIINYNNSNWNGTGGGGYSAATVNGVAGYQKTYNYSSHLGNGVQGSVYVWVNPNASVVLASGTITTGIQAVVKAIITLPPTSINSSQATIIKEAEAYMAPSSYFPGSVVGKKSVSLDGTVDSYNSTKGPYGTGPINANASVGSPDVLSNSVAINQAKIAGQALVGGSSSSGDLTIGSKGSVGTAAWVASQTGVQTGHATYNFTTSFPDVITPTPATAYSLPAITSGSTTLPRAGDSGVTVSGVTTYYYNIDSISLSGNGEAVNIGASSSSKVNVVIILTNTLTDVSISGKGSLNIASNSTLVMYAPADVSIAGNGVLNGDSVAATANSPASFQLYGTQTAAQIAAGSSNQSISIAGNGVLSAAVYAPNANISMNGGGSSGQVLGAVVGDTVTVSGGHYPIHYDESLANLKNSSGLWSTTKYRELYTASDRNAYAAYFP